jgi:hypothetical protein
MKTNASFRFLIFLSFFLILFSYCQTEEENLIPEPPKPEPTLIGKWYLENYHADYCNDPIHNLSWSENSKKCETGGIFNTEVCEGGSITFTETDYKLSISLAPLFDPFTPDGSLSTSGKYSLQDDQLITYELEESKADTHTIILLDNYLSAKFKDYESGCMIFITATR